MLRGRRALGAVFFNPSTPIAGKIPTGKALPGRLPVGIVVVRVDMVGECYSAGVISLSVTHLWLVMSIPSAVRSTM